MVVRDVNFEVLVRRSSVKWEVNGLLPATLHIVILKDVAVLESTTGVEINGPPNGETAVEVVVEVVRNAYL